MLSQQLKEIYKELLEQHRDELQQPYDEIVNIIGADKFIALCDFMGSTAIYLPRIRSVVRSYIYEAISKEFDGNNQIQLARKYGVSDTTVYTLMRKSTQKDKAGKTL